MAIPLAQYVRDQGHEVVVVAEGLAAGRFEQAGFNLYKGTVDFKEEPFLLAVKTVLKKINPQVVVVTASEPSNLDKSFALSANILKIPLVLVEDLWTSGRKIRPAEPQLILTLDKYAKSLVCKFFPNIHDSAVHIVGNYAVNPNKLSAISNETDNKIKDIRKYFDKILVLAPGCPYIDDLLKLLIRSLEKTSGEWCLIPRFHPKHIGRCFSEEKTYGDKWKEALTPLGERVIDIEDDLAEGIVARADITLSDFSSLMTTAVCAGKVAVSLQTEEVMKYLKKEQNLYEVPLVALGCAQAISEPTNLSLLKRPNSAALEQLKPYDVAKAYKILTQFL